jgi:hypothetical protein
MGRQRRERAVAVPDEHISRREFLRRGISLR